MKYRKDYIWVGKFGKTEVWYKPRYIPWPELTFVMVVAVLLKLFLG